MTSRKTRRIINNSPDDTSYVAGRDTVGFKSAGRVSTGMNAGDRVRVERGDVTHEGVLLPSTTDAHLVVKLDGGYNVGVDRDAASVDVLETDAYAVGEADAEDRSVVEFDDELPTVSLISTGGTIASTVDYRTGAVTAQFDAEDVLRAVPELAGRANYRGRVVANMLSENMEPPVWRELAAAVHEEIEAGADGVVVMHGTDTMQYTASALAFMLETPVPIVFTGSQRSADRPSSDNVMNAVCAVEAATSDCAEVMVCMHDTPSDDVCALHRGTRVRKNHTSRRNAFETVGGEPLGRVDYGAVSDPSDADGDAVTFDGDYRARGARELALAPDLNEDVQLLKFTPGMDPARLEGLAGVDGLVVEGTGLGHVHTELIPTLAELVDDGTVVAMSSACIEGRVCDRVYDTGRDLLEAGVVEAEDTLPETAYVKLMWALANREDPAAAMGESLAGEATARSTPWR
jgi:glutamyl-tRNA(Gln) amidotransferase subunit D